MKRAIVLATVLCLLAAPAAHAQFFGQLGSLSPRAESGLSLAGGYFGMASDTWGATGQLRFGIGPKMDVGLQAGYRHFSIDLGPYLGGSSSADTFGGRVDLKAWLANGGASLENLLLGGDLDVHFSSTEGETIFGLAAVPAVSLSGAAGSGQTVAGWAGFGAQIDFSSGESSSTALLRLGGEFDFTEQLGVVAEFNHGFAHGGSDEIMAGLSYGLKGK